MDLIVGLKLIIVTSHRLGGMGGAEFDFHDAGSQSSLVSDSRADRSNMRFCISFKIRTYPLAEALRLISLKSTLLKFPVQVTIK